MVLSMGGFAVAAEGVVAAPFVAALNTDAALFEGDEDGGLGGIVMVLEEDMVLEGGIGVDPDVGIEVKDTDVCPGGTILCLTSDTTGIDPDTVAEDEAGPVTKGVGNGPVPVIEVGETV